MRRALTLALSLALAAPAAAQDAQTLADIRQELAVVFVELQKLKRELVTTGAPGTPAVGGTTQERVDALEAELSRLTAATEALEGRVGRVVQDGTNRIGDLEFRVCELEPGCDIAEVGDTLPIGGEAGIAGPAAALPVPGAAPGAAPAGGAQLAMSEQADFDAAKAAFDGGEYGRAAELFGTFANTYTGGPLTGEAHFYRGQALERQGDREAAARAYLDSFSGSPQGPRAPEALLQLGLSLDALGQRQDACLTLGEVQTRFPGHPVAQQSADAAASLGCG